MPRTSDQLQRAREERRGAILEAALAVFARYGYEGASIRLIAQQANIAQGLLYNYFESKDAVLRAIIEQGMHDVLQSFADAQEGDDPRAQLERLIRRSFALIQEHRDFWRLSYSVRMQPEVLATLDDLLKSATATIIGTLETHTRALGFPHPSIEAALLFAQVDGIAQHYVIDPEHYPLDAVIDALVARYTSNT